MGQRVLFRIKADEALRGVEASLARAGLTVLRTFEQVPPRSSVCNCRGAVASGCSCRFTILLAFGPPGHPAVVTAAGRDGHLLLEIASNPNARVDPVLIDRAEQALLAAPSAEPASDLERPRGHRAA